MTKKAKRKIPVRRWAYALWREYPGKILVTLPSDGEKLEELIGEHGELTVMVAFALFIKEDPPLWHLEPVEHVDKFVSKKGNTIVTTYTDEGAITHFALALFISKADGYLVEAHRIMHDSDAARNFKRNNQWFYIPIVSSIIHHHFHPETTSQE